MRLPTVLRARWLRWLRTGECSVVGCSNASQAAAAAAGQPVQRLRARCLRCLMSHFTDCCVLALQVGSTGGTELCGKWKSISRFSEGTLHVSLRRGTLFYASIGSLLRSQDADSWGCDRKKRIAWTFTTRSSKSRDGDNCIKHLFTTTIMILRAY